MTLFFSMATLFISRWTYHGRPFQHAPITRLIASQDVPLSTEKLLGKGTSGVSNGEAQYVKANGTHHDIGLRPHSPGHSQDEDGDGVGEPVSDIVFRYLLFPPPSAHSSHGLASVALQEGTCPRTADVCHRRSPEFSRTGFEVVPERAQEDGCTVTQSIFNLANTIVGAGVMALPR